MTVLVAELHVKRHSPAVQLEVLVNLIDRMQPDQFAHVEQLAPPDILGLGSELAPGPGKAAQKAGTRKYEGALQAHCQVEKEHEGTPLLVDLLMEYDVEEKEPLALIDANVWWCSRRRGCDAE
jgi:hypothetical protein